MRRKNCSSCDGKGRLIDMTYDRSGEEVECVRCYGTGRSQEYIYRLLAAHRAAARQRHRRREKT
jgi:DnaJ-class molecular chaperone